MDNIQNCIYLILGAIYFISKLRKNKKASDQPEILNEAKAPKKYKTFEELLGEFTNDEPSIEREVFDKGVIEAPVPFIRKDSVIDNRGIVEQKVADEESKRIYLEAIKGAEMTQPKIRRFDSYKIKRESAAIKKLDSNQLRKLLLTREWIRQGIVLNAILTRKY